MTLEREILPQAAVLPVRKDAEGNVEVLLIRRENKVKWGLPKGVIESHQTPAEAARAEALEEAGIGGELSPDPVCRYSFRKKGRICHVSVFLMWVSAELSRYEEQNVREREWFPLHELSELPIRRRVKPVLDKLPALIESARLDAPPSI